jgi:hypothetical protein
MEKNQNKNTGLFINCMYFVVVRTKINGKEDKYNVECQKNLLTLERGKFFIVLSF